MTMLRKAILMAALVAGLCGCSTIDKLTGETDNTVLPGQREDAIPGRTQFPENSGAEQAAAPQPAQPAPVEPEAPECQPEDPACQPAADGDTFSDPQ